MDLQKFADTSGRVLDICKSIKNRIELIENDLEAAQELEAEFGLAADALAGVRTSWRVPAPRPRGFAEWFFVRSFSLHKQYGYNRVERCQRFWIKELLPDQETAEKTLPPNLLGTFAEVERSTCAKAKSGKPNHDALVVGRNECVAATHLGEEWELHLYKLCLHCPALTLLCRHVDDHQFQFV